MRILPPKLFFAVAALMILAHVALPGPPIVPDVLRWCGLPLVLVGAAINGAAALRIHRSGTTIKTFDEPSRLLTDGLYAWSRNPIYLGFAAMLLGGGLMSGGVVPLALAVLFAVLVDRWYIRFEEATMARVFGDDYAAYRARVRRWL